MRYQHRRYVLLADHGIQCALWCEIVTNQKRMDYAGIPQELARALAEGCWTHKNNRNWLDAFSPKGSPAIADRLDVNYRNPWKAQ